MWELVLLQNKKIDQPFADFVFAWPYAMQLLPCSHLRLYSWFD